jgi:ligand-binding sensor domain-containing protein/serine phosphatase RsbU (regulator of sigma subunit)
MIGISMSAGTLRTLVSVLVLLALPSVARSQSDEPQVRDSSRLMGSELSLLRPGKYVQPLPQPQVFEWITDQLPQSYVRDIVQDPQGFMWFGTQSGLSRFDGHRIRNFLAGTDDDPLALNSGFITALEIGADGRVWIGTGEAGISVYDPKADTMKHYRPGPQQGALSGEGINTLHRDHAGTMWIGTSDGVLDRFDPQTDSFAHTRAFAELETSITDIVDAGEGLLWIATVDAGLFKFDPASGDIVTHYLEGDQDSNLSSNSIASVFQDKDGAVWVGTEAGLDRLDPAKGEFTRFVHDPQDPGSLADNRVNTVFVDSEGILWVCTSRGVHRRDPGSDSFVRYARNVASPVHTASYPADVVAAYEDRTGVLWFASPTGVAKLDKLRMRFQPYYNLTGTNDVTAFTDGEPGVVWAGTYALGLQKYDFDSGQVTGYSQLGTPGSPDAVILDKWIMALHRDRKGQIWLGGTELGLVRFNPETGDYKQYLFNAEGDEGPSVDQIHWIVEDAEGYLWLATWGGGLNRFDPKWETFVEFRDENSANSLSTDYLYTLAVDRSNPKILWIGTARGGLNRFDTEAQRATHYTLVPKGSATTGYDSVQGLFQDPSGVLWLATDGGGLVRFDPKTEERKYYGTEQGLSDTTIYGILPDDDGRLWMSTASGGLSVFDPRSEKFVSYSKGHGLVTNKFVQNCFHRSSDGTLFFSGGSGAGYGSGFNAFKPSTIQPDGQTPTVALTSFQIFGKEAKLPQPIWTAPTLSLDYTDSVFAFEYSALSYASPDNIRYSYKMDGLHDWITTDRRFVTYTNIDGGNYVFRIKAANRHGVWGDETAAVTIQVASPPWRTWWAYTLYGLVVVAMVLAYLRYQTRRLANLQQAARLEAVERDLELTGAVQTGFLPSSNMIDNALFRLFGFYRPADQASGDWWFYEQSDAKLIILVGDVTGHGPGPAMVTAAAATAFRIQARLNIDLDERLRVCNEEVLRVGAGRYQMTMSVIELDGNTGRFVFYSAGGQPILRIRYDGKPRSMPCAGTPLGTQVFELGKVEGRMAPGERMLLYTDGIPEMPLGQGRLLGMRRFSTICESTAGLSLGESVQKIALVADSIRQNSPQYDDWTFTMIEWAGEAQPGARRDSTMDSEWSNVSQGDGWSQSNSDLGGGRDSGRDSGSGSGSGNPWS